MYIKTKYLWVLPLTVLLLAGCSGAKETLGLERQAPDEFKVLKRAPLEQPPNFTLRPPKPGAERPQEQEPSVQAKQSVFGNITASASEPTSAEAILLRDAQAGISDPNIREKIDSEAGGIQSDNRPVADKILGVFGGKGSAGDVIDPVEESARIKEQAITQTQSGEITISE